MRATNFIWTLALALAVQAQQLSPCATTCLQTSMSHNTTCGPTDIPCICSDTGLQSAIEVCVLSTCTIKEALVAKNSSMTLCGAPIRDLTAITPIVTGVSGGLAVIAVSVRTFSVGNMIHADTVCAIIAILSAFPMGVLEMIMSHDGFGRDIWTLTPDKITRIVKFTWLTEIFYFIAVAFTKMSFLFLYLRIFPAQHIRRVVHVLIGFCIAYGLSFTIACILNCLPVTYIWNKWHGETTGTCINFNGFAWAHAAINIASDLIILCLPIPELLKLSMNKKKKFYVIIMFSMGFFITIVSIIRLRSLIIFATTPNPTYDAVPTAYWSVLECYVGIICVCLPSIRVLLSRVLPSIFASTQPEYEYSDTPIKSSRKKPSQLTDFSITKTIDATVTSVPRGDGERFGGAGFVNERTYGNNYGGVYGEDGLQLVEFDGVKKAFEGKGEKGDKGEGTISLGDQASRRSSQGATEEEIRKL
ncbi:hypothetical protein EJ05DRAFT_508938 [Pseudovirgaria hyperparasitica]|uniref:CFEM domain-containing protein n=1 Tax=Pseudovirgaria hyperparasitica TaxID=470096 RepID=A0A6A6WC33_9PEZI|nr:uncharacterized protein EJ05DRAFT_508938 [Pseudovirgaria hyperparasitica]KAF2760398.1 hypothetical protein EJ05DRAFT_508938 [Pseudovirgaria hyperparasitica]